MMNRRHMLRAVVLIGTLGALWAAAAAPFYQGAIFHPW